MFAKERNQEFGLMGLGALSLGLAILLGALCAHALKNRLTPELLQTFQVGVHYQQLQSLGLLIFATYLARRKDFLLLLRWPIFLQIMGMILFSGNCYLYALTEIKWIVHLVPLGGVCMIVGWLWVSYVFLKYKDVNEFHSKNNDPHDHIVHLEKY